MRSSLSATSFTPRVNRLRQQIDDLTAYLNASMLYGADETWATALCTLNGFARSRTSEGNLLPFDTAGLPNAPVARTFRATVGTT